VDDSSQWIEEWWQQIVSGPPFEGESDVQMAQQEQVEEQKDHILLNFIIYIFGFLN
jgi:hypothetical protein